MKNKTTKGAIYMLKFIVIRYGEDKKQVKKCIESVQAVSNDITIIDCSLEEDEELTSFNCDYCVCETKDVIKTVYKVICETENDYVQIIQASDIVSNGIDYALNMAVSEDEYDLIVWNMFFTNGNSYFKLNLSAASTLKRVVDSAELLEYLTNCGGEDRFVLEVENKACKKDVLKRSLLNLNQKEISFEVFLYVLNVELLKNAQSICYEKNEAVVHGIFQDSIKYKADVQELLSFFVLYINNLRELIPSFGEENIRRFCQEFYRRCSVYKEIIETSFFQCLQESLGFDINKTNDVAYFNSLLTSFEPGGFFYFESIKRKLSSNSCKCVGFDVFDTTIERPFWEPTDLFELLSDCFNELLGKETVIDFALIRKNGEQACREYYHALRPSDEDVTLQEIYDFINDCYGFDKEILEKVMQYEIALEKRFCKKREIGQYLYHFAKYHGKEVVFISDMYLPLDVIRDILSNAGYDKTDKLYLSNALGVSKYSGQLFKYVLNDIDISGTEMCYLGDNYEVDVVKAQLNGIIPFHIPKAVEVFKGYNNAIYGGNMYASIFEPDGGVIDQNTSIKFLGIRCMLAVVANKLFGNPFVAINRNSNFDANPYWIGYFCAGMFLLSEAKWLHEETKRNKVPVIHFIARDGFYVKKAYDLLSECFDGAESDYMYFSRKVVAPLYMKEAEGIYELFLPPHILNQTPQKIIQFLEPVLSNSINIEKLVQDRGIIPYKKFQTLDEFYRFAKVLREELYDKNKAREYEKMLEEYYFGIVHEGDAIFDVGYSGRLETALSKLLNFKVNSYYFHAHEPWAFNRKRKIGFDIDSFYGFKPCSAFVLREQIFTIPQPSCIGLDRNENGVIEPKFGTFIPSYRENRVLGEVQSAAVEFVKDMVDIFGENLPELIFNSYDACMPFEFFLHYASDFDRELFRVVTFEDEFGTNAIIPITDYWDKEARDYKLNNHKVDSNIHQELLDAKRKLSETSDELKDVVWRLEETRKSFSYRLGFFLTKVPRGIREIIRK